MKYDFATSGLIKECRYLCTALFAGRQRKSNKTSLESLEYSIYRERNWKKAFSVLRIYCLHFRTGFLKCLLLSNEDQSLQQGDSTQ